MKMEPEANPEVQGLLKVPKSGENSSLLPLPLYAQRHAPSPSSSSCHWLFLCCPGGRGSTRAIPATAVFPTVPRWERARARSQGLGSACDRNSSIRDKWVSSLSSHLLGQGGAGKERWGMGREGELLSCHVAAVVPSWDHPLHSPVCFGASLHSQDSRETAATGGGGRGKGGYAYVCEHEREKRGILTCLRDFKKVPGTSYGAICPC